jgi:hypothetical protein
MAQNYTQDATTRSDADAILAIAPFVAAISVSPAPLSSVETLEARLVVIRRNGLAHMYVSWRPKSAGMTPDERAGALPPAFDVSSTRRCSPVATRPLNEVREFSKSLA